MTTVSRNDRPPPRTRVPGLLRWAVLVCLVWSSTASAHQPPVHWLNAGAMPPGAIGSLRLRRGEPLSGYFQPVRIRAPIGARISLAEGTGYGPPRADEVLVGLQIGHPYRLKVSNLPADPSQKMFPTVEVIDRLHPPAGLALRYPIPIELTAEELDMAARGLFVTRVVYLEDPRLALPVNYEPELDQPWIEAPHGADPLVVADELGRPVAILRIGGRVPMPSNPAGGDAEPPLIDYGTN